MTSQKHSHLIERGMRLQNQRKFREAEQCYQSVLFQNSKHPDALHLMGLLAVEANLTSTAIDYLQRAVKLLPRQPIYLNNLGNALLMNRDPVAALGHLRKAVKHAPGYVEAITNLGRTYRALGKTNEARRQFEKALAVEPGFERAEAGLAEMYVEIGDLDAAVKVFRSILARQPDNIQALGGLSAAMKFTADDTELDNIDAVLKNPKLIPEHQVYMHHAAGKICNDLERYDDAMRHYFAGKKISGLTFAIDVHRQSYAALRANFSTARFLGYGNSGNPSQVPVFIVGMPRSGTTLTEQIISSHPQASGAGELPDMRKAGRQLGYGLPDISVYSRNINKLDETGIDDIATTYLASLTRGAKNALRITDKNPQNFEQLGLIAKVFPNARIIHCRRDALDTCVSNFMQSFDRAHGYNANLATLGKYYREYSQLMDHWRDVLPVSFMDVDYEELVADQEGVTRKLIRFLDLDWDEACLRYFDNKRSVTTPSRWQVRQPIYTSSVKRWKRYERHLGPLITALGDLAKTGG